MWIVISSLIKICTLLEVKNDIKRSIKNITFENREYFKFKFPDVRFDKRKAPKTEEELLRATNRKTMNGFLEWEKSPEYANLVAIYLQSK